MLGLNRLKRSLSEGEQRIVALLLEGDTEFLEVLRSQLSPPFHLLIERRTPKTRPMIYRTPPNEYHIDLVFDDRLSGDYSAGSAVSLKIDDLVVVDNRLPEPIVVEGSVNRGILTNMIFRSKEPVRWPKHLIVDEWWYVGSDGTRSKQRVDLGILDHVEAKPSLTDLPDGWFRDVSLGAFDGGHGVTLRQAATETAVAGLETRIAVALPDDFAGFLRITDGAILWDTVVFGCEEVYELDEREFGKGKVLFSQRIDGSLCAFDLSDYTGGTEYPVLFFDHDSHEESVVSHSFRQWLENISRSAAQER